MTQSGGTHMYYGKDGYWKKVQEYLPEENRLTGVWRPDEYFVGIGRFGIHIDHYRVKEPKARVILFHGVGGNGRLLSLIAVPLMKQGYEVICPDLPLYGMTEYYGKVVYQDWVDCAAEIVMYYQAREIRPSFLFGLSAGGILAYQAEPRSYRDLPIRMGELGLVHRHEKSGQLHGLMRVRCFTQDDAHIFMMPEQIRDEIKGVVALIDEVYQLFGFKYHVELSTRPEDSMGSDEDWELATEGLRGALNDLGLDYVVNEGDGAFYGPKIDFHLTDSIGRTWQCGTIQLDMQLPQRFELEYTGADGEKHRPIMIHRVAFGSIERFIGILIEHFAGAFPTWLAPVQVKVLPISDKHLEYGQKVLDTLNAAGIRAEIDTRAEKIGYKIREAQMQKIPYMLVVGAKEEEENLVSVRSRFAGDEGQKSLDEFVASVTEEIATRARREVVKEEN